MSQFPVYSLAGGNQYPAVATASPAQYPVIALVDSQGNLVSNVGNGPADGVWTTMTLSNATPDATNPPEYMKDSRGIVHCRGKLTATTAPTTLFTFPVGFRPYSPTLSTYYFHWNLTPNAASVNSSGVFQTGFASVLVDISLIHFTTVLS